MPRRTYLYKLTSDRGGAPCAPPPRSGRPPLLTLSICKPAIRRTAAIGDRILGLTSRSLAHREGYPLNAVIYAAEITGTLDAREYYLPRSRFRSRPDCIYAFHRRNGVLAHAGLSPLHAEEAYRSRDIGQYPYYRNGRILLSSEFRYFGVAAIPLTESFPRLTQTAEALGQGHRVFEADDPEQRELEHLFRLLWRRPTSHTPGRVTEEAAGHMPRITSR